jgi:hypothetical protein
MTNLSGNRTLRRLGGGFVVLSLLFSIYLAVGGLYRIIPIPGCTVCAFKINKVTGKTWYLVRDREIPLRPLDKSGKGYVYNPHTGEMEPE